MHVVHRPKDHVQVVATCADDIARDQPNKATVGTHGQNQAETRLMTASSQKISTQVLVQKLLSPTGSELKLLMKNE